MKISSSIKALLAASLIVAVSFPALACTLSETAGNTGYTDTDSINSHVMARITAEFYVE